MRAEEGSDGERERERASAYLAGFRYKRYKPQVRQVVTSFFPPFGPLSLSLARLPLASLRGPGRPTAVSLLVKGRDGERGEPGIVNPMRSHSGRKRERELGGRYCARGERTRRRLGPSAAVAACACSARDNIVFKCPARWSFFLALWLIVLDREA